MYYGPNNIDRLKEIKKTELTEKLKMVLSNKIMNLEYSYLEDPYYLDLKERAVFAIVNQGTLENIIRFTANSISDFFTMVTLIAILATLGPVLIIAILISVALCLGLYALLNKQLMYLQNEMIPINRKYSYYYDISSEKQFQKDIRLYNLEGILYKKIKSFVKDIFLNFYKMENCAGLTIGGMDAVGFLFAGFCYIYVGLCTISPGFGSMLSIGDLTFYVTSAITFNSKFFKVGEGISTLFRYLYFLDPYFEFINLADETINNEDKTIFDGDIKTLEFKNVTFTYPKAPKPVLSNISFKIEKGQKISIVGLNGAGKSTLVKLICRMYKADSGQILVNGKDIYDYDYMSYMNSIATVFQDYKLFNFTIDENITCKKDNKDQDKVWALLEDVGLKEAIEKLPNGINSVFGREYNKDGIELSGGQSQKIAIARALYKKSSLVILDEPASALDPISEAEIYEKFNSLVQDKTAIYISHRMSSSVFCDKILIIDGGSVSDFDTHANLMQKTDCLYYKLFMAQAENYQLEEDIVNL